MYFVGTRNYTTGEPTYTTDPCLTRTPIIPHGASFYITPETKLYHRGTQLIPRGTFHNTNQLLYHRTDILYHRGANLYHRGTRIIPRETFYTTKPTRLHHTLYHSGGTNFYHRGTINYTTGATELYHKTMSGNKKHDFTTPF